jgi:hypothetical protein
MLHFSGDRAMTGVDFYGAVGGHWSISKPERFEFE